MSSGASSADRLLTSPDHRPALDAAWRGGAPLVFLAGPIQGARDWQREAAVYLLDLDPRILVANPRRSVWETLAPDAFDVQVDWETRYLRKASIVLFWLAEEQEHVCTRAFGQTTRFELAEWKLRHEIDGVKIVVGISDGFSGARYLRRRFAQDCPDVPICASLPETCLEASRLANERWDGT